jgi:chloramphenicol 3-O phosphotransferase
VDEDFDSRPTAGRIIFLNGASSSGKTTLAKALQSSLDTPFLHVSSDQLVGMLPERRDPAGPFAWWTDVRPKFFAGFHRCIPALAAAGNDLIVDHIIEFPTWRDELASLLRGFDVFLVGVHCDLTEIDRRETQRGDRRPGEGRTHVQQDGIHTFGPYDFEITTTTTPPSSLATTVLTAWAHRSSTSTLTTRP